MTRGQALLQAHIAVFFMGVAGVAVVLAGFGSWQATLYRVVCGGLILGSLWLVKGNHKLPKPKIILICMIMGILLSVHWFAFFRSIELLGVMLGSAMLGMEPLLIAIAAAIFLKERLNRRTKIALIISSIGFLVMGLEGQSAATNLWVGVSFSVLSYGIFAILVCTNRYLVRDHSVIFITAVQMISAIPLTAIMTEGDLLPGDLKSWAFALFLGVICTGFAHAIYNGSMKVLDAPVAGLLLSLEVVYGMVGGLLIGDTMTTIQFIASILIANILILDVGYYCYLRRKTRFLRNAQHEA